VRPAVTAAEMRALDRAAIDELGLPGMVLMETAGRAVAAAVERLAARGPVAVVCGPGNNGGDGYVIARVLAEAGRDVVTLLAAPRDAVKGDAAAYLAVLERAGGRVVAIATAAELAAHADVLANAAVIVDAVFGVGTTREVTGHYADVLRGIERAPGTVVAVDLPSGIETDTGRVLGVAVTAELTVTMAALKIGTVTSPGFAYAGRVEVADIGIPRALIASSAVGAGVWEAADARAVAPRPRATDHKGTRGHALVLAGAPGARGAGRMAAVAALRAGAGLVTLAAPVARAGDELAAPDPVMTAVVQDAGAVTAAIAGKAALVVGPGMGRDGAARARLDAALAAGVPAVLDADALALVAGRLEAVAASPGPVVLTPHPKEAAALLGASVAEVEADRLAAARAIAARSRSVVVLKGARTVVCDGTLADEFCTINPTGSPALATAGSGDVLAGVIGGLLAQGVGVADAARLGVWVHGAAGERLAARFGERGAIASDLPEEIAIALAALRA
jgi:ADP-dependent NAD(P)H-hydrate dehydratase / NAD(P)H-hydrate epimerase